MGMMKKNGALILMLLLLTVAAAAQQQYTPSPENIRNRETFQEMKFGVLGPL